MSFIEIKDIKKKFGSTNVLNGISLSINEGEQVVIKGASGSGKSTLMYLLGGLDKADSGFVKVGSLDLKGLSDNAIAQFRNKFVGFIFQFHFLLPSMNCLDNILLPFKIGGGTSDISNWIYSLGDKLGVTHCFEKYPFEISGGEQQRINIIRALSMRPKLLLCDEPTGNLDSKNSNIVIDLLKSLSKEFNSTLIVVTHDSLIAESFDRKITIEDGYIIS